MELSIGAELQDDVDAKHRAARQFLLPKINEELKDRKFEGPWVKWSFFSIIMRRSDAYKEVRKRHEKTGTLEFRLRVDHALFRKATQEQANAMLLDVLFRSVEQMPAMGVPQADVAALSSALANVKSSLADT